ncbi:MAG: DegT/DnrJ/EryC1/StrS family aminotransferase [Chloroflexi bacterium]|nr:DegT/DnrJ/EryC1/StrS family aminotransferase [Chloroflexota bacterium]
MKNNLPAILGGKPAFPELVQMVRPVLPSFSEMAGDVENILSTGMVTKGRFMREFEQALSVHLGVKHAVAVSSCTSGMMLTHKALELSGDVIVPSFTFMATVSALVWAGLCPIFVDVDRATNNLDPAAAEAAITPQTTAIIAVHQFGNPADIVALEEIANRHSLKLIFDAAHGAGACYQGVPVGKQGTAQIFSLSPTKLLISGEGGIVATNSDDLAAKIRMGREYGNDGNYDSAFAGLNARMPEFNALLGMRSLENLEAAAQHRNETVALFQEVLGRLPGIGFQQVRAGDRHSYRELSITIESDSFGLTRDELALALAAENIDTRKYYQPPIHMQTAYRSYYDGRPLPNTDWLSSHSLSLPMWSNMSTDVSLGICETIQRLHENAPLIHKKVIQ